MGITIINLYQNSGIHRMSYITSQFTHRSAPFKNTRQTEYLSVSPQGSPPVWREHPQRYEVAWTIDMKYLSQPLWAIIRYIHLSDRYI